MGLPLTPSNPVARTGITVTALAAGVLAIGTIGYAWIEGWGLLDAFYMTVITVTTVGFGELQPLSRSGQVFTVFLILAGVVFGGVAVSEFTSRLVANRTAWRRRNMEKSLEQIRDHVVLCGYGRLGQIVRAELEGEGRDFVVIDHEPRAIAPLIEEGLIALEGDATHEEVLERAAVRRASGVIATVGSDADNMFITLTARELNPHCPIVARAEDPRTEKKLQRVGATSVVTPYQIGGQRLAHAFLRPGSVDLADMALLRQQEVQIEELALPDPLPAPFNTLAGLNLGQRFGLIAVAVRQQGQKRYAFNPRAETVLAPGDQLMVMGKHGSCTDFQNYLRKEIVALGDD